MNPFWIQQISHLNTCSTYRQDWCQDWKQLFGKFIHWNNCHLFNARKSTSFRILCCSSEDSRKFSIDRCMRAKIGMFEIFYKMKKIWQNRRRVNGIRVDHFPRIQHAAAQWGSQKFYCSDLVRHQRIPQEEYCYCRCSTTFLVQRKTIKKMSGKGQNRISLCQKKLGKDNEHLLVMVFWKRGTPSVKTVHEESGTELQKEWNAVWVSGCPISVQQLQSIGVSSKAKDTENCRYILQPLRKQVRLSHNCICKSAQSLRSSRWNVWRTWIPSRQNGETVRPRQKPFLIVMTQRIKIFSCNDLENDLRGCHSKINWVNIVWMQDFWVLLKLGNISWLKTLDNNFMQWLVLKTLFQQKNQDDNQKDGSKGTKTLGPF